MWNWWCLDQAHIIDLNLIFYMKKFTMILFAAILTASLTSAIKSAEAEGDSEYIMHIQIEVRNAQDQLVSVTESIIGNHIYHEISDRVFDSIVTQKEIVAIDGIKYEKVQLEISSESPDMADVPPGLDGREYGKTLQYNLCGVSEHDKLSCVTLQSSRYWALTEPGDVSTAIWTILRSVD